MTRFLAGLVIGLLLACSASGSSASSANRSQVDISTSNDPGELDPDEFDLITIDDKPCIIWKDQRDRGNAPSTFAYSGLTCDWDER